MTSLATHIDYLAGILFFLVMALLMYARRLPSPDSFEHFLTSLNTKGGNILILTLLTYVSLQQTVRWFYHLLAMISEKQLTPDNAIATLGAQFLTTTAFGMFAGALISTLTGQSGQRKADNPPPANGGGDAPKVP